MTKKYHAQIFLFNCFLFRLLHYKRSDGNWKISLGKTKIIVITDEDDKDTNVVDLDTLKIKKKPNQRTNKFAGLDIGYNSFVGADNNFDLQGDAEFLEVDDSPTKSLEVAINVWEKYMPIAKEKFGLMTGLGIKYNSYELDQDLLIVNQNDSTFAIEIPEREISKNKFKTTSIHLPLMFETNLGKDADHSFHMAVGGMVNWRIIAKTKQKYEIDGDRFKEKDRNDFNINTFQFAAVARVGYGDFTVYASYNLTPLFEDNQGPEVYPFTVGISVSSF